MLLSIELLIAISSLFLISLVINLFYFFKPKKVEVTFDESFMVLNTLIQIHKDQFNQGLLRLRKSYAILTNNGNSIPPTDRVKEYAQKKQDLKILITKKVVRSLSPYVRKKILNYYADAGLVKYISVELDKQTEENN